MMDARTQKLARLLGDADLAQELVTAGLETPRKIKDFDKGKLEKALGKDKAGKVLKRFGKGK
jgi:hypothetical protein